MGKRRPTICASINSLFLFNSCLSPLSHRVAPFRQSMYSWISHVHTPKHVHSSIFFHQGIPRTQPLYSFVGLSFLQHTRVRVERDGAGTRVNQYREAFAKFVSSPKSWKRGEAWVREIPPRKFGESVYRCDGRCVRWYRSGDERCPSSNASPARYLSGYASDPEVWFSTACVLDPRNLFERDKVTPARRSRVTA